MQAELVPCGRAELASATSAVCQAQSAVLQTEPGKAIASVPHPPSPLGIKAARNAKKAATIQARKTLTFQLMAENAMLKGKMVCLSDDCIDTRSTTVGSSMGSKNGDSEVDADTAFKECAEVFSMSADDEVTHGCEYDDTDVFFDCFDDILISDSGSLVGTVRAGDSAGCSGGPSSGNASGFSKSIHSPSVCIASCAPRFQFAKRRSQSPLMTDEMPSDQCGSRNLNSGRWDDAGDVSGSRPDCDPCASLHLIGPEGARSFQIRSEQDRLPLTFKMLISYPPELRKQILGKRIYTQLAFFMPREAGIVTQYLLEMDNAELVLVLQDPVMLRDMATQAKAYFLQPRAR